MNAVMFFSALGWGAFLYVLVLLIDARRLIRALESRVLFYEDRDAGGSR